MVAAVIAMGPQPPRGAEAPVGVGRAIADGLGFVRGRKEIMGTLTVDLMAMTFGMPRALFPALALDVYGTGAAGVGLLHAAVSAGATLAVVTAGWIEHARRLGRIVLVAVAAWGVAIAVAGFADSLWLAVPLFAVAGAADGVSAILRGRGGRARGAVPGARALRQPRLGRAPRAVRGRREPEHVGVSRGQGVAGIVTVVGDRPGRPARAPRYGSVFAVDPATQSGIMCRMCVDGPSRRIISEPTESPAPPGFAEPTEPKPTPTPELPLPAPAPEPARPV
jgi:hypothetical protein